MTARGAASVTGKSARNRIASAQVLPVNLWLHSK
jgi:hypothetical protein